MPVLGDVVQDHACGGVLAGGESLVLAFDVGDALAVERPAGLAGVGRDVDAVSAVEVHVVDVADAVAAAAFVGDEADLGAVGRNVRVHLIDVRRIRQVDRVRAVGVADEDLPVALAVGRAIGLVHDLERDLLEIEGVLGQRGRDRLGLGIGGGGGLCGPLRLDGNDEGVVLRRTVLRAPVPGGNGHDRRGQEDRRQYHGLCPSNRMPCETLFTAAIRIIRKSAGRKRCRVGSRRSIAPR
jgi:hypothetical protein